MSAIPQPTPESWAVLQWLAEHGWSTAAQLLDRVLSNLSVRAAYQTLERMAEPEGYRLLQRARLNPSEDHRSQYVYGLATPGLRLLGILGRPLTLSRGQELDLTLQLAEVRIYREEEGWIFIPAHDLVTRWWALGTAQKAAMALDPKLRSKIGQRDRAGRPLVSETWLPPLPTLWHPRLREARTLLVLSSPNPRRLLPWRGPTSSALNYFQPVHLELVTLSELGGRKRALEGWLKKYLDRLNFGDRVWELHDDLPSFRHRVSPRSRGKATTPA